MSIRPPSVVSAVVRSDFSVSMRSPSAVSACLRSPISVVMRCFSASIRTPSAVSADSRACFSVSIRPPSVVSAVVRSDFSVSMRSPSAVSACFLTLLSFVSPLGTVHGTLLVQCLPDNTDAVITDANGEIWPSVRPTLDATITKLKYTWVTLSITSVRLPARVLTVFKTLVDYGFARQNYVFAPDLQHITREPVFPLGLKALFKPNSGADLQWAATYLSGTRDKFMLILHTGLLGDSE